MKKSISIQQLSLVNFKGIKSLTIGLQDQTNIFGANGTGKTTIADAFTWLLFGKDTTDRKDFEIKTLDANGVIIPEIDHEVSAVLSFDNDTLTLRRVLKENWVKKRGNEVREFAGNVTELYWNEVPVSVTEFTKKVNEILLEQVFKMITSPTYFNSIKWQDRRNLLIQIFGEVSNEDIAKGNPKYEALVAKLTQGKSLEDYNAQIKASIKKAKDDLELIPARKDEVFRSKPEAQDFRVLEIELEGFQRELTKVDTEIADLNKAFESKLSEQREVKVKANNLKAAIQIIESDAKKEAENRLKPDTSVIDNLIQEKVSISQELQSFENAKKTIQSQKVGIENQIKSTEEKMEVLRNNWQTENAKQISFNDDDFHCPTCKREFEAGDVEAKKAEAITNFNNAKKAMLNQINVDGGNLKTQKENLEVELKAINERLQVGTDKIIETGDKLQKVVDAIGIENTNNSNGVEAQSFENVYESILALDDNYQNKLLELQAVEQSIEEAPSVDNSELVEKRKGIVSEIDTIKSKLQTKTQIDAAEARLQQLSEEEKSLSQQIANVEKEQFLIENFIKEKVDRLEEVVNSKFKFVKFKMFDQQINGGLKETCEAMVNGVPYSDVNTASKINAGLDIINVLSEFYGISAPIFIDNAESVHTLIDTESQIIRLVVSEQYKELFVECKELVV